jgi:uncharacterized membrane protein required for colicin V production
MIVMGVVVGRRRGMSAELLSLLMWLAIVLLGGQFTPVVGRWTAQNLGLGPTASYTLAYLAIACAVWLLVVMVRRQLGDKLLSADAFGGFEYYLGMMAGSLRFICILLFVLAVVHAPKIDRADIEKRLKAQRESLGSIYFPPFGSIQQDIFERSISGNVVKQHLTFALIQPDPSAGGSNREGIGRRRENEVNEIRIR